jgi:hypothetical protein
MVNEALTPARGVNASRQNLPDDFAQIAKSAANCIDHPDPFTTG